MLKTLLLVLALTLGFPQTDRQSVCNKINALNTRVLNGTIDRKAAVAQFGVWIKQLNAVTAAGKHAQWVFPLKGYRANAIGGVNGNGYIFKGYSYLDGNKHKAHPAHDVFITDRDQNDLDDRTNKPVDVLSVDDGVVIACSNIWDAGSTLRGGKYIWVYHPQYNYVTYYAHNRELFVKPGDEVKQGQKIAEVGRTGFSAYRKRSPTHLHFSAFSLADNVPVPFNPYSKLVNAARL
ncbi:M23 family metallopeptidase [Mucilaginibacter defluvii]|uniref:M23ase beta-sheet core domain-containing protein n=1 Tax=Mucilaginibacter defluvii TaxID=1196019 RepID=A0ABP9FI41_9SPHI